MLQCVIFLNDVMDRMSCKISKTYYHNLTTINGHMIDILIKLTSNNSARLKIYGSGLLLLHSVTVSSSVICILL